MRKEARTGLSTEMARMLFKTQSKLPNVKVWMFEQSDHQWTVAWVVGDAGEDLSALVAPQFTDDDGQAEVAEVADADAADAAPAPDTSSDTSSDTLGRLSARYESNGRPDAIGFDKKGGFSYGAYQIATRTGTMDTFLAHLKTHFPAMHAALLAAGGAPAAHDGSEPFKKAWVGLARDASFGQAQHDFIRNTHYQPFVRKLKADLGLDADTRSAALRNVLWSVAVQHGAANTLVQTALAGRQAGGLDDKALIQAIYAERSKVDLYFAGSTPQVRLAVAQRFVGEQAQALTMLA